MFNPPDTGALLSVCTEPQLIVGVGCGVGVGATSKSRNTTSPFGAVVIVRAVEQLAGELLVGAKVRFATMPSPL